MKHPARRTLKLSAYRTQTLAVICLLPFIACCVADPDLNDPGLVLLTGPPAIGGIWLLIADWHCGRLIAAVITAVNRAAASALAGSEVERMLRDEAPMRDGRLGDQPGWLAALTRHWLIDGQ